MNPRLLALLALALPQTSAAFCGTYVGSAGAELFNANSQVIYVTEGRRTTLTMSNDYQGSLEEFGLVLPVPSDLRERDVQVVEPDMFALADAYTSPRLVEYTCDTLWPAMAMRGGDAMSCAAGSEAPPQSAEFVTVEAAFERGEYDMAVISATGAEGLAAWLSQHRFETRGMQEELLQELIDEGANFLVARVALDRAPGGGATLSPLRLTYRDADPVIPIRLGATSSPGEQDLVVYALGRKDEGGFGIANYPQAQVESQCMYQGRVGDFGDFYAGKYEEAVDGVGGTGWVSEYTWSQGKCDPCTVPPLEAEDLEALGYRGRVDEVAFTRLHIRLRAEDVDQDLQLTRTPLANHQQRFIRYKRRLEEAFPVCGDGWAEDPGSCWDERARPAAAAGLGSFGLFATLPVPLALWCRRRRRSLS
jgi:hypothetical protein